MAEREFLIKESTLKNISKAINDINGVNVTSNVSKLPERLELEVSKLIYKHADLDDYLYLYNNSQNLYELISNC